MANQGNLTLMAVHAHPDDESLGTGGILALYSAEGITTVLVTCTNGEYGDGPDHVKPGEAGHDPAQVAKVRFVELEEACRHLGVTHHEMLGYHDSGMADWPYKDQDHVFAQVPSEKSISKLIALFEHYRPDVVVTYDERGGYNHPDHLQAHHIAVEAFRQSGIGSKLYYTAGRRRRFDQIRESMQAAGIEVPERLQRQPDPEAIRRMEETEARITTTIDVTPVITRKRDAIASHASQMDDSWWLRIPDDSLADVFGQETFIRVEDNTGAPLPEDDLFAGLR